MNENYYQILEVSKLATQDEIKSSYKKLAIKYHPDKHKSYDSKFLFSTQFSRWGAAFGKSTTASNFGVTAKRESPKGTNIDIIVDITLDECIHGINKIIKYNHDARCPLCDGTGAKTRKKCDICKGIGMVKILKDGEFKAIPCNNCHGSGLMIDDVCLHCKGVGSIKSNRELEIVINKGTKHGDLITICGKGNSGSNGGACGDLNIYINELPHKKYTRNGNDLVMKYETSPLDLILGNQIEIETPYGKMTTTIPAGTQPNSRIRIKEMGINGGDLYVGFNVIIPTHLDSEEIELYQQLRKKEFLNL